MDGGVRGRRHPYRQFVSEVNAWLIVWLLLIIVNRFVTRVVVGGNIDGGSLPLPDAGDALLVRDRAVFVFYNRHLRNTVLSCIQNT
jgi:hypothetical protein